MSDAKRSERSHAYLLEGAAALKPMPPRITPKRFLFFGWKDLERSAEPRSTPERSAGVCVPVGHWERELSLTRSPDREH